MELMGESFTMQLLASRTYEFIDGQSLEGYQANDRLFRISEGSYVLHMSSSFGDERLVRIGGREALIWINESPELFGDDWFGRLQDGMGMAYSAVF